MNWTTWKIWATTWLVFAFATLAISPESPAQDRSKSFIESNVSELLAQDRSGKTAERANNQEHDPAVQNKNRDAKDKLETQRILQFLTDASKSGIERSVKSALAKSKAPQQNRESAQSVQSTRKRSADNADATKRVIEAPVELNLPRGSALGSAPEELAIKLIRESLAKPNARVDESKSRIETGTKNVISPDATKSNFDNNTTDSSSNPKVVPGKVNWYNNFDAACIASSLSGKPVLHFQLLGNLDQRFT